MDLYVGRSICAVIACSLTWIWSAPTSARDEQICTINQTRYELQILDLPDIRSDFVLCLESRLSPTIADEHVHCRMYWKLAATNPDGQRRCTDFEYLYPTSDAPFGDDKAGDGEVCLVRQVSEAQQARGESGWYYLDDASQRCPGTRAGAVFPLNRPERFEVIMECGIALEPEGQYRDVDIRPDQCVAPPSAADARDVGKSCSPALFVGGQGHQLTFGGDQCASDVCLTTPLGGLVCTEQDGIGHCGDATTRCSCRCAGESADDPGPFCACPEAYECKPMLSSYVGSPETRGSYCAPIDGRVVP